MTPDASTRMAAWLESAWLARYLDRALTDSETIWFETYVLDKPDLLTMIEGDTQLRDALVSRSGSMDADSARTSGANTDLLRSMRARMPQARTWTRIAATFVFGLGIGLVGVRWRDGFVEIQVIPSPTRITFDTMRGIASAPIVEAAGSASSFVLVEVPVPPAATDVVLIAHGRQIPLAVSRDGFASFLFPRKNISPSLQLSVAYRVLNTSSSIDVDLGPALETKK